MRNLQIPDIGCVKNLQQALPKLIVNSQFPEKMEQSNFQNAQKEFDELNVCKIVLDPYNEYISAMKINSKS
jgi:hypothetical protein